MRAAWSAFVAPAGFLESLGSRPLSRITFEGDVALEGFIQSKVNGAHPTAEELFHDWEVTATLADESVVFFGESTDSSALTGGWRGKGCIARPRWFRRRFSR